MDTHLCCKAALAAAAKRIFLAITLSLACAGCKSISADRSARAGGVEAAANDESELPRLDRNETLPAEQAALESGDWIELPERPLFKRDDKTVRWRHLALEPLMDLAASDRPDLSDALAISRPIVAANAAIVMARWGTGPPPEKLVEAIRATELPMALRCAAAEALGLVQQPSPAGALRDMFQELSADKSGPLEKGPELHAELLRAMARHAEPGDEKWFTLALRSSAWQVRYEALNGWAAIGPNQNLPPAAVDLRSEGDPRIRAAALRAIAAHRGPRAIEYLQEGLGDRSFDVHLAAIAGLGELGSDDARVLLGKLKGHKFDLSRAATVGALATAGMHADVEAAASDASWQVRLAVAQTMAQSGNEGRKVAATTVVTAQRLARDASAEVQQQAVESLATWPLDQAGPVLLLAMAEGGYLARKTAAAQLAARWPAAAEFPADADAEHRIGAIADLRRKWSEKFSANSEAMIAEKAEAEPRAALVDNQVQELLQRLSSTDVTERRGAAADLAIATAGVALSAAALDRLAELTDEEQDPVVWRSALTAIAADPRDPAVRMAYTAVGHASVEIRRGACGYLAAHGDDPHHGEVLLGVLQDPDRTVVLAAVRALGAMRRVDDPQPLARMLVSPDKQLQLEAALSLARLQVAQAAKALERLTSDADPELRLRAAQAMGEVADPIFLPVLITMLTDQAPIAQAAMIGLAQIAETEPMTGPDGTGSTVEERVRGWQLWYRERQDRESDRSEI